VLADLAYDDERVAYLQATEVPFVLVGRLQEDTGYCWVDTDNAAGSVMAVQHLAAQGHQRIAYLGWPSSDAVADRRLEGYRQGLASAGNLPECIAVQSHGQPALEQAQELLGRSPRPTAVVAACDEFAYDTIRAATALGLQVGGGPGRIAVVGCDDSALAAGRPGGRPVERQARQPSLRGPRPGATPTHRPGEFLSHLIWMSTNPDEACHELADVHLGPPSVRLHALWLPEVDSPFGSPLRGRRIGLLAQAAASPVARSGSKAWSACRRVTDGSGGRRQLPQLLISEAPPAGAEGADVGLLRMGVRR
jgi:Periplasmic binding protein-like domain